jgi:4a-hydroxytetrahydrobiopterin dehydratase
LRSVELGFPLALRDVSGFSVTRFDAYRGDQMALRALNEPEITAELQKAASWKRDGQEIVRQFVFSGFKDSILFVNAIAEAADKADHHPDILIQYSKVTLRLSTHDCKGLSARDFALAKVADELASRCG